MDYISELLKEQKVLLNYCNKICGNSEKAKDLLQDTNVKVLTKIEKYNPNIGTFRSWIMRIAHNIFIDSTRKKEQKITSLFSENIYENKGKEYLDGAIMNSCSSEETDHNVRYAELEQEYSRALGSITYTEAKIFEKRRKGYLFREVSVKQNMNIETVKVKAYRARVKIQISLRKIYPDEYNERRYGVSKNS